MNSCEWTLSITAIANTISCNFCTEELEFFSAALIQLGDTLHTICAQREAAQFNGN